MKPLNYSHAPIQPIRNKNGIKAKGQGKTVFHPENVSKAKEGIKDFAGFKSWQND